MITININTITRTINIHTGELCMENMIDHNGRQHVPKGNSTGGQFTSKTDTTAGDINKRPYKHIYLTEAELEQLKADIVNFNADVKKMLSGQLSKRYQMTVLSHMTAPYNSIPELKGKKLLVSQDVYKKIVDLPNKYNKNHNIDTKRAIKLPILAADPQYVLKSVAPGHEDRFVVVTSSRGGLGERLSIIIQPNTQNIIVSAYDENIDISKEKKAKRVVYSKKEKLQPKS